MGELGLALVVALMDMQQARHQIARDFPKFHVEEIRYLGEGFGNTAFEVNRRFVFRFAKTPLHREELQRELPILELVAKYSPLPTPRPEFIAADHSYVGYRKLHGNQLIHERTAFSGWRGLARQIGEFMAAVNTIPSELVTMFTTNEETSLHACLAGAQSDYEKVASVIPRELRPAIERFLAGSAPPHSGRSEFCHNDLGIEHILVSGDAVSGIIDWGDAALSDPSYDLGLIYRDCGRDVLQSTIDAYLLHRDASTETLTERAIFYGKCASLEDIDFGMRYQRKEYSDKGLQSLTWIFSS